MQIFLTSPDYKQCAKDLDDKRLQKIIVESAQIASTALWMNNCDVAETLTSNGMCYLPTHEHHPLCKWAAESYGNYIEVLRYGIALCDEYYFRTRKIHKTFFIISLMIRKIFAIDFKYHEEPTLQPNCTTNHKHIDNVYEAYWQELLYKWANDKQAPTCTIRNMPNREEINVRNI